MKGVVLAGGRGTRLDPLTRVTNKHLLPMFDRPMIHFPLQLLARAGIDHVILVTGGDHAGDFLPLLGDGRALGLRHLDYVYQDRPAGIAHALSLAGPLAAGDDICLLLGDNLFEFSIRPFVDRFLGQGGGARVLLAEVSSPEHYGVPMIVDGRIERIEEKPSRTGPCLAVTGCYLYDSEVFDIASASIPSARGELEITEVNNAYIARGRMQYDVVEGYWIDCGGSVDAYLRAAMLVAERGANHERD